MTAEEISLVQESWKKIAPIKETAAALFYMKLFELDPALRAQFDGDTQEQGRKLMQMVTAAVRGLDRLDLLYPALRELGMRQSYAIKDEHYGTVASALLWTLERGLQADFTPPVKSAWINTYGVLSQTMRAAAGHPAPPERHGVRADLLTSSCRSRAAT